MESRTYGARKSLLEHASIAIPASRDPRYEESARPGRQSTVNAAMNWLLPSLAAALATLSLLAAQSSGQAAPVSIPEKQWVVLPLPAAGKGISRMDKHVTLEFTPFNNRIYFTGGDY